MMLGGVDPGHVQGDFTTLNVTHADYWEFHADAIRVGDTDYCEGGCSAIADTGTSLLAGPSKVVNEINKALGAIGVFSFECEMIVQQFVPEIIAQLVNGSTPDQICSKIGLCPGKECGICKIVLTEVDKYIASNKSEAYIEKVLDQICSKLPSPDGEAILDCSKLDTLPNVDIVLAGKTFSLTPKDYVLEVCAAGECECICEFVWEGGIYGILLLNSSPCQNSKSWLYWPGCAGAAWPALDSRRCLPRPCAARLQRCRPHCGLCPVQAVIIASPNRAAGKINIQKEYTLCEGKQHTSTHM